MTDNELQQLKRILEECNKGRYGMEKYEETLEDPYICTKHFDKIETIVNSILNKG